MLVVARAERPRDRPAIGVADVFRHLIAEGAFAKWRQPIAEAGQVATSIRVLGSKRIDIAEDVLIDQGRETVELEERVLERGRGQQKLAAVSCGKANSLADLVARTVGVPQLVGLIDDDEIPSDAANVVAKAVGEGVGTDENRIWPQGIAAGLLGLAVGLRVEHSCRQIELLGKFKGPLLPNGGRGDHEEPPASLRPVLAEDDARLDGFAEAYFVGENHALR